MTRLDSTRNSYSPCLPNPVHQHNGPCLISYTTPRRTHSCCTRLSQPKWHTATRHGVGLFIIGTGFSCKLTPRLLVCLFRGQAPSFGYPSRRRCRCRAGIRPSCGASSNSNQSISALPSHKPAFHKTQASKQSKNQSRIDQVVVLTLERLGLLLLLHLEQEGAVDVWQHTTVCNRRADQGVELFVTTDGELEVAGCDTLDLEVLGSILSWKC